MSWLGLTRFASGGCSQATGENFFATRLAAAVFVRFVVQACIGFVAVVRMTGATDGGFPKAAAWPAWIRTTVAASVQARVTLMPSSVRRSALHVASAPVKLDGCGRA